jgi:hypothetical protein
VNVRNQVFRTYAPGTQIQVAQRRARCDGPVVEHIARDTAPARSALEKVCNKPSTWWTACYAATLEPVTDPARCRALFPVAAIRGWLPAPAHH